MIARCCLVKQHGCREVVYLIPNISRYSSPSIDPFSQSHHLTELPISQKNQGQKAETTRLMIGYGPIEVVRLAVFKGGSRGCWLDHRLRPPASATQSQRATDKICSVLAGRRLFCHTDFSFAGVCSLILRSRRCGST